MGGMFGSVCIIEWFLTLKIPLSIGWAVFEHTKFQQDIYIVAKPLLIEKWNFFVLKNAPAGI
tara:strand:- start:7337 stop:7522 length:186 start_codon:yes stop_codon:yes gene_type:complete